MSLLVVHNELSTPFVRRGMPPTFPGVARFGLNDIDCVGTVIGSVDLDRCENDDGGDDVRQPGVEVLPGPALRWAITFIPDKGARWRYDGGWAADPLRRSSFLY